MLLKGKYAKESQVEMTELVLPNDTNQLGNLLGGRLMHWMDIAAAICAQKHTKRICVTAFVDEMYFHHPISLGEIITLKASVNRTFNTSLEVGVLVISENRQTGKSKIANEAYFTFVALDEYRIPVKVPPVIPQKKEEKKRFKEALVRREHRLLKKQHGGI